MSELKTKPTDAPADDFINTVEGDTKRADGHTLLKLFTKITGEKPRMWGTSMVGFGMYHYKSERSRQEGDWPLVAFSPRKQNLTLYLTTSPHNYRDLLDKLGKHKTSVGCLYINKLADIDMHVLEQLIKRCFADNKRLLT